jgi:RNA polymerase sigma-70 factor (ECF subfamily)
MAPHDPDTAELVDQVRRGDRSAARSAANRLLGQHRERLRRMVAVRIDDRLATRVDPSDVVQEVLMVASQRLPQYVSNPSIPFYPWLRQIAWNCLVDLYRRHVLAGRRSVDREQQPGISDTSAALLADQLLASGSSVLGRLLRKELRARVRAVLGQLSAEDREILLLRHLEQLTMAECAAVTGISETAATQRQLRALKRLRRLLEDESSKAER